MSASLRLRLHPGVKRNLDPASMSCSYVRPRGMTYCHPEAPQLGHVGAPSATSMSSSACSEPHSPQSQTVAKSAKSVPEAGPDGSNSECRCASFRKEIISSGAKSSNRTASPATNVHFTEPEPRMLHVTSVDLGASAGPMAWVDATAADAGRKNDDVGSGSVPGPHWGVR